LAALTAAPGPRAGDRDDPRAAHARRGRLADRALPALARRRPAPAPRARRPQRPVRRPPARGDVVGRRDDAAERPDRADRLARTLPEAGEHAVGVRGEERLVTAADLLDEDLAEPGVRVLLEHRDVALEVGPAD